MARYFSGEINKTKIVIIFFIIFSAVTAYAATQLSKTMRPMTLEEYERYDGRLPARPQTIFDVFIPFSL